MRHFFNVRQEILLVWPISWNTHNFQHKCIVKMGDTFKSGMELENVVISHSIPMFLLEVFTT